ncbi:MAG: DUF1385 domain-containing protein, partial [Chloroflexi bacterium]|nr:DUF1385 domain-containing protein [Chloroflexota bacterium]
PLLRGTVVLLETLVMGILALNRSAELAAEVPPTTDQAPRTAEEKPVVAPKDTNAKASFLIPLVLALTAGIGFFFLLPLLAIRLLDPFIASSIVSNLLEGLLRLMLLLAYIWGIRQIEEIRRVFAYHGAEHMAVHAYEQGDPLEVNTLSRYPTAHPRCGTAFLLTVMVVSVIAFSLLGRPGILWSVLSRVALIPVIAGLSYELIRLGARGQGKRWFMPLIWPGLALQGLTTHPPDTAQMEVAIAALKQAITVDGEASGDEATEASQAEGSAQQASPSDSNRGSEGAGS